MISIGIIGYGYWGLNIVRVFMSHPEFKLVALSDIRQERLDLFKQQHPEISTYTNNLDLIRDNRVDLVAIVTPVHTHYHLTKIALEHNKHVFVEKPFTPSVKEALELIDLAEKKNLQIMVDHTFLFTSAVQKIKSLIDQNVLGKLYYFDSIRVNLGIFQSDINVIWDLAPHDISILNHITHLKPKYLITTGLDHFQRQCENIAYVTMYYEENFMAHLNVNWLSPVKVRNLMISGEHKMLVWNDLDNENKLRIYDKGVSIQNKESIYNIMVNYRSGDMYSPNLAQQEALRVEANYLAKCLSGEKNQINNAYHGLEVVQILEAANQSLRQGGRPVEIKKI